MPGADDLRVLIVAPVGKDARLIGDALAGVGIASALCVSVAAACREMESGAGALFLTEEAFENEGAVNAIATALQRQPRWSDLPLVICYGKDHPLSRSFLGSLSLLDSLGHLTLLERPMNPRLLHNAVRSALRSRARQYERRNADAERQKLLDELQAAKDAAENASKAVQALLGKEKEARQASEEAGRSKDVFLATLSHELRTPLNAILGFSELLPLETPGSPDFEAALSAIVRNARAQRDLINDILDVSRIISGKLHVEKAPVDLVGLVDDALESCRPAAREKNISVTLVSDFKQARVLGDQTRLQQVIWNLLSNALKFTPIGGVVRVEMRKAREGCELSVSDNGDGIEADFLPFVFDRFRQQDGSFARRHGGLGLGLSIVQYLVEAHGGEISVTSGGKGKGAAFCFALPLLADNQTAASLMDSEGRSSCHQGVRVLVVDDEPDCRALMRLVLERSGASVTIADSAASARRALQSGSFDAIFCDLGMPGEDGLSFVRSLRESTLPGEKRVPCAALTGFVGQDDKVRVQAAGFDVHLAKPVLPADVLSTLDSLLAMGRGRRGFVGGMFSKIPGSFQTAWPCS